MHRDFPCLKDVKSCASFALSDLVPRRPRGNGRAVRDPAAVDFLGRVVVGLSEKGYRVTEAKTTIAVGFDAVFRCHLSTFFEVDVLLAISERHNALVNCELWTIPVRPIRSYFSLRKRPTDSDCVQQFQRLLDAINDQVANRHGATSVSWLTEKEFNRLPELQVANRNSDTGVNQ